VFNYVNISSSYPLNTTVALLVIYFKAYFTLFIMSIVILIELTEEFRVDIKTNHSFYNAKVGNTHLEFNT